MTTIQDRIIQRFIDRGFVKEGDWLNNPKAKQVVSCYAKPVIEFLVESIKEVKLETRKEILEIVKHHSANLPIDIERQGGLYAQGMHAGIDLCIDEILSITNNEKQK